MNTHGKKSRRLLLWIFVCAIFIASGVASAYFFGQFQDSPQRLVLKAYKATRNLNSYASSLKGSADINTSNGAWKVAITSSNKNMSTSDVSKISSAVALDVVGPKDGYGFKDIRFNFLIAKKDISYIQFTSSPKIFFITLDSIFGKWIKLEVGDFKAKASKESAQPAKTQSDSEWKNNFFRAYSKRQFLTFSPVLKEAVEGEPSYHLSFGVDKKKFQEFFSEYAKHVSDATASSIGSDYQEKIDSAKEALAQYFSSADISGEIWIGEKDFYMRKISIHIQSKERKQDEPKSQVSDVAFVLELSDFNKQFEVSEPKDFMTLQDAFKKVAGIDFSSYLGGASEQNNSEKKEFEKDTDNDMLTDSMEKRLNSDPNNPDSDGDGYKDGEEFNSGYNPNGEGKLKL